MVIVKEKKLTSMQVI